MEYLIIPFLVCFAVGSLVWTLWGIIKNLKMKLRVADDTIAGLQNRQAQENPIFFSDN